MAKILVEDFACGEGVGQPEVDEESKRLMEEMGLTGQLNRCSTGSEVMINPYSKMTVEQKVVWETILTSHIDIKSYSKGPIPLRVLQIASHAREFFDEIRVWHEPTEPDPLLVGVKKTQPNGYVVEDLYALARWGDALESWPALVARCRERLAVRFKASLEKKLAEAQAGLASIDSLVTRKLQGEWVVE